jgi:hypothetical protein
VEVLAPEQRLIRADPALSQRGTDRYEATFAGLPDRNLSVFVAPVRGGFGYLSSWWLRRTVRPWLLILIAVGGGVLAGWLIRSSKPLVSGTGTVLRVVVPAFVVLASPLYMFQPNGISAAESMFAFMPAAVGVNLSAVWLVRRLRPISKAGLP